MVVEVMLSVRFHSSEGIEDTDRQRLRNEEYLT